MQHLSQEQLRRVSAHLQELSAQSKKRDEAREEEIVANAKWNAARAKYAEVHAQIVAEFGSEWAPEWMEPIHGPRNT